MASETSHSSRPTIHDNPMYEEQDSHNEERSASVRRQVSEPAFTRNRVNRNLVNRTKSTNSTRSTRFKNFFGINDEPSSSDQVWKERGRRMLGKHGKLKQTERGASGPRFRSLALSQGFDETDGVFQSNRTTAKFSDSQTQFAADSIPEDITRSPALRVTFRAIALASNALKKRISNRDTDQSPLPGEEPQMASHTSESAINYESDEDFFVNEDVVQPNRHEVDSRVPVKWNIQRQVSMKDKSIPEKFIETLLRTDNSNRRELGKGFIDKLLDRKLKNNLSREELEAIDNHVDDFRPYFTYWITTVQILILIISMIVYGFGYFGVGFAHIKDLVYVKSLSLQQVDYFEAENFWFGPRYADLIHLGAKFTPCMRRDKKVYELIEDERQRERHTGCCIRNDGSGCVQTYKDKCSPLLSTFHKWENYNGRTSGPVCGQDPSFCFQPASIEPYVWANDVTKWPICKKKTEIAPVPHMKCELIARPCCVGVFGECHITTREFCDFIKGFFNEEATLCSQVSCMEKVCGMIPFYSTDSPNQFYRIWTPIFLHAGLLHLVITVVFQYFIMRDVEKMIGTLRITIIYMVSGIGGYLASAVFLPFRPEVGPAGSLYGMLACFIVQIIKEWKYLEQPIKLLSKMIGVVTVLFIIGLLPWVDNYAHILGFIIGFLLSVALIPDFSIGDPQNPTHKMLQIVISLSVVVLIIILLFVLLYKVPIYDIAFFKYLNCVPLTSDWCANQEIHINHVDIL